MPNTPVPSQKSPRVWLTRSWYTLPKIAFIVGCVVLFFFASYSMTVDSRGFGCSLSPCIDTGNIDQSYLNPVSPEDPVIKDTFSYVTFNSILAPSLFSVKMFLPEDTYEYSSMESTSFFIDRANEDFSFHTLPRVVISETDEQDVAHIARTLFFLSLINIPLWFLYSIGMLHLAQQKPKLWYLWVGILLIFTLSVLYSLQRSVEHFG